jgi:hypothetical protein
MSARQELLAAFIEPGALDRRIDDLDAKQLAAARELFQERREQLAIVRRRAEEAGITEINSLHDLVPLLLAHTSYKSYPASFMEQGRWDRMLQWLQTLSVENLSDTDIDGVTDVDDWIRRLRAAGHMVQATSGSTGKVSFLNHSHADTELKRRHYRNISGWPFLRADNSRRVFIVGPSDGPNSAVEAYQNTAAVWARPGEAYFLTDEPILISDTSKMAALRNRIAEGLATPGEIEAAERAAEEKAARMQASKPWPKRSSPTATSPSWSRPCGRSRW